MKNTHFFPLFIGTAVLICTLSCPPPPQNADPVPEPGNNGTLAASTVRSASLTIGWTAASDDETSTADLEYLVYHSDTDDISTVEDAELYGTAVGTFEAGITSKVVAGLAEATVYYFNVVVRDGDLNKSIYTMKRQGTSFRSITETIGVDGDKINGMAIDADAIFLCGYDAANYGQWRIEKRDIHTGQLIPEFDTDGIVTVNQGTGDDSATGIAIDSTYLYVCGYDTYGGYARGRIEKRSKTTGALAPDFGTSGIVNSAVSGIDVKFNTVCIDTQFVYAAGYSIVTTPSANAQWRIEKRSRTTGALVAAFDTDGILEANPGDNDDIVTMIAADAGSLYIGGYSSFGLNDSQWVVQKRNKTTGASDNTFDDDGEVTVYPASGANILRALSLDSSYLYIAGSDATGSDLRWRCEKRSITSGDLVTAFDSDGVLSVNPTASAEYQSGIALDAGSIYLSGTDANGGDMQWRVEKRQLSDGALAGGFGTDGVVSSNPGTGADIFPLIVVDANYLYVAGTITLPTSGYDWRIEKRLIDTGMYP